jgi:hypothetical protein
MEVDEGRKVSETREAENIACLVEVNIIYFNYSEYRLSF